MTETTGSPGHPDHFEFRLSPDRREFAIWEPGNEPWFIPASGMQGRFVGSAEMDGMGWTRYLPAPADRAAILREAAEVVDNPDGAFASNASDWGFIHARTEMAAKLRRMADEAQPETPECDGCGHPVHPARECPVTLYGERCACDEPVAVEAQPQSDTETRTPCSVPNPCEDGGEPCDRHEREESHADGEHELCGPECDAGQPSLDGALRIVGSWYEDVNDGHGLDAGDLISDLERAGYPLPAAVARPGKEA